MQLDWKKFFFFFFCMEDGLTLYTTRLVCKFSIMFSMHFPKVLTRRICLTFKRFFTWWLFPLLMRPTRVIQGRHCKEKIRSSSLSGQESRDKPEMVRKKKEKKNLAGFFKNDSEKLRVGSYSILYLLYKIRDVPASPFLFPATTKARRLFFLPLDVVLLTLRN